MPTNPPPTTPPPAAVAPEPSVVGEIARCIWHTDHRHLIIWFDYVRLARKFGLPHVRIVAKLLGLLEALTNDALHDSEHPTFWLQLSHEEFYQAFYCLDAKRLIENVLRLLVEIGFITRNYQAHGVGAPAYCLNFALVQRALDTLSSEQVTLIDIQAYEQVLHEEEEQIRNSLTYQPPPPNGRKQHSPPPPSSRH